MSHVNLRSGSEGPSFDPYHFDEITVDRPNGDVVTIHQGLAEWCKVERGGRTVFEVEGGGPSRTLFEAYVGCSPSIVERAYHSLPGRRMKAHACRPRSFLDVGGFPGESLTICNHCGEVVDYSFDRGAVE